MKRRSFLYSSALTGIGLSLNSFVSSSKQKLDSFRGTYSLDGNVLSVYTNKEVNATKIIHITDTHLSLDDERGNKYQKYSQRMAQAYKVNKHFKTGEEITAARSFEMTLKIAKEQNADFLALTGDIFSFPSEAAVGWALQQLTNSGIPFAFVAGNHDWHYEGMKGSSMNLREIWTTRHLKSMYQGNNPLFAAYDINGIRIVCIDNSTYEILPEQLEFLRQQVKSNLPLLLLMHIPLYMPGRNINFGCAHPDWGEEKDKNFKIERREKWRKEGHTKVTFSFYEEVFTASNILAVLAGHTHRSSLDIKEGIPQLVSAHNAAGFYSEIRIKSL